MSREHPCSVPTGGDLCLPQYPLRHRRSDSINDGGGGHPIPDLFCPTIRVPLRATVMVAGKGFGHDLTHP
jgi:hypothetical protein